jgi:hypothetical protein
MEFEQADTPVAPSSAVALIDVVVFGPTVIGIPVSPRSTSLPVTSSVPDAQLELAYSWIVVLAGATP